ncbi:MAG: hypothetical protein CMP20_15790 [Rickettsiales bacterium]|nr:hypothetical protein [Rickettsiales bacterium]
MSDQRVVAIFGKNIGPPFAISVLGEDGRSLPRFPIVKHGTKYIRNPETEEYDEAWLVWRVFWSGDGMKLQEFTDKLHELHQQGKLRRVYISHGVGQRLNEWKFGRYGPETFGIEPTDFWDE